MSRRPSKRQRARRQTQKPSCSVRASCFCPESKENPDDRALFQPLCARTFVRFYDVDEREKMVRQMWNVYKHSKIVTPPRFWLDAFGAAYQDLTSEVSIVKDTTLLEIAKMSFRSRMLYDPPLLQSNTRHLTSCSFTFNIRWMYFNLD